MSDFRVLSGFCQGFIVRVYVGYARVCRGRRGTPRSAGGAGTPRLAGGAAVGGAHRGRRGNWTSREFGRHANSDVTRIRTSRAGGGDAAVGRGDIAGTSRGHRGTPHIPSFRILELAPIPVSSLERHFTSPTDPYPPGSHRYVPVFQDISYKTFI